jgi:diadenosine tetraphosphatase ApaH/serine/threonine PP2A family protein phosphatase
VKYAIVSDIHSNIEALTAVLARVAPEDGLLCLGDVVGYGPNPNECVAAMRERATACVLGNHDVAAVDGHGLNYFNPLAREALLFTQRVLAPEHRTWLDGLGYELRKPDFLMVHGAPVSYFTYILDKAAAAVAFHATDAPLIFVGHTHIAEYYALEPDGNLAHRHMQQGGFLQLEPGLRYLVNVGSVGQPRDLNPNASFAFYDDAARTIAWERVAYPIERVQEKIEAAHLPEMLATRLSVGR